MKLLLGAIYFGPLTMIAVLIRLIKMIPIGRRNRDSTWSICKEVKADEQFFRNLN
jgi:hypothetical protein